MTKTLPQIKAERARLESSAAAKRSELEGLSSPTNSRGQARLSRLAREIESLDNRIQGLSMLIRVSEIQNIN